MSKKKRREDERKVREVKKETWIYINQEGTSYLFKYFGIKVPTDLEESIGEEARMCETKDNDKYIM